MTNFIISIGEWLCQWSSPIIPSNGYVDFNISFNQEAYIVVTSFYSSTKDVSTLADPLANTINGRSSFWSYARGWAEPRILYYAAIGV